MSKPIPRGDRAHRIAAVLTATLSAALLAAPAASATAPAVTVRSTYFYGLDGVAQCNPGETAIGGGVGTDIPSLMYLSKSEPTPNTGTPTGWKGSISRRIDGTDGSGAVYAVCASNATAPAVTVRSTYFYGLGGVAQCNPGETAIGGGVGTDIASLMYVSKSEPTPNTGTPTGWKGSISRRIDGSDGSGAVYAVCATSATAPAVTVRSTYFYGLGGVAPCNAGETAIGGGVGVDVPSLMYVSQSEPTPNTGTPTGWKGSISRRADGTDGSGAVYAVCAAPTSPSPSPSPTQQPAAPSPPAGSPQPATAPATAPTSQPTLPATAKPAASLSATGSAKRSGSLVRIRIAGELHPPPGVVNARGCKGTATVSVARARAVIATRTVTIDGSCTFTFRAMVKRSRVRRAKTLGVRIRFNGNDALAAVTKIRSIKVSK